MNELGLEFKEEKFVPRPEILLHPNVPKPLHGLNPRTVMGRVWWDKTRFAAQEKTGFRCAACGVHKTEAKGHKWLEGHEFFSIDYTTGRCEVVEIVSLCNYCHNFIHSGRLYVTRGISLERKKEILRHGFKVLTDAGIHQVSEATGEVARLLQVSPPVLLSTIYINVPEIEWTAWHLIIEGKRYESKFKSYMEWKRHYSRM